MPCGVVLDAPIDTSLYLAASGRAPGLGLALYNH